MGVEQAEATAASVEITVPSAGPGSRSDLVRARADGWDEQRELTDEQRAAFLAYVTENRTCSVKAAAIRAGVRRVDVKRLLRENGEFQEDYRTARGYGVEQVYGAMVKLGIEGVEEPVVSAGKLVRDDDGNIVTVRKYSDRIVTAMFNALTPEGRATLGHKIGLEITGADGGPVKVQRGVELADVARVLLNAGVDLPAIASAAEEAEVVGEVVDENDEPVE